ncbi:hypothetical protein E2320_020318 [Naja naja]|nr:hypothetical protein E2320_020318 [Naja naja]
MFVKPRRLGAPFKTPQQQPPKARVLIEALEDMSLKVIQVEDIFIFTPEKDSKTGKPAQMIADNLVYFMKKKGIDKSLKAIGEDPTNVNAGCEDDAMCWIEVKAEHAPFWS